jgi:gliding motility-associated-like protein
MLLGLVNSFSQTYTITDVAPFGNTNMNMWGTGGAFSLNKNIEIFRLNPGTQTTSVGYIANIAGSQFGAKLNASLYIDIGSNFVISGFSGGSIDVDYPVEIDNIIPVNNTFEKGEWLTLGSDFRLRNSGQLLTSFPTGGSVELKFHFGFGVNVNAKICVFGCVDIPLLPPWSTTAILGAWPPIEFAIFGLYHDPITNTFTSQYPCLIGGYIPSLCNGTIMPIDMEIPDLGLKGEISIPQTVTSSSANLTTNCLSAYGRDEYMRLSIDMLTYLAKMVNLIPGAQPIATIIDNLSNTYDLPGGVSVGYTLFSAEFVIKNFNVQKFTYCPNVNEIFSFPTDVKYRIKNSLGTIVSSGYDDKITFHAGNDFEYKYPCNYEFLDIVPEYKIDETENSFNNKTYDSIDFSFDMAALSFDITIPKIVIFPSIHIPEFCFNLPYPCPSWSNPFRWCTTRVCTPEINTPELAFGPYGIGFGPLWSTSLPVADIQIPWFDRSWPLKGMGTYPGTTIRMIPRPYELNLVGTDILCKGDNTGSIAATITNGTPPYSYEWGNSVVRNINSKTDIWNNLTAGIYFLKVTDKNGCSVFASVTLTEPARKLAVLDIATKNVSCNGGNDGDAKLIVDGGTSPYYFNWSSGGTVDSVNNLIAGSYSVTITDDNGCFIDTSLIITEPVILSVSSVDTKVLCNGDSTGTSTLTVQGGTFPFTYLWSNGSTFKNQNKLPGGNHSVVVTDLLGCTFTHNITTIQPALPLAVSSLTKTDVNCFDGNDGTALGSASGGTPPYKYAWYNASGYKLSSASTSANNLPADTYTFEITDSNKCKISSTILVDQPLSPLTLDKVLTNVKCYGGSDGAIDITISGGTINYSYLWSNGAVTKDLVGITAGNYSVTITDNNECTLSRSFEINQPEDSLKITFESKTNILCFGKSTGDMQVTVTGGTPNYVYSWNSGQITEDINLISAGNYNLTVTDTNLCATTENYVITEPLQAIAISEIRTPVSCYGENNGAIDVAVTGGTSPYTFVWVDEDSTLLRYTSEDISNMKSGDYTIFVTDSNGCIGSKSFTITQPLNPLNTYLTSTNVNCFSGNDGTITLNVTGGTSPYSYNWSNGATSQSLTNITEGWYSVIVTDFNLCTLTDSILITEPQTALQAYTKAYEATCFGGDNGKINLTVSGGTSTYTFNWSNGETTQNIDSLLAGNYTVVITDFNGCTANSGGVVGQPSAPLSITYNVDSVTCYGYEDGHIRVDVAGGTMPYELQWADSMFLVNVKGNDIYSLPKGTYNIILTDGRDCKTNMDIIVEEPDSLIMSMSKTDALCFESLDGSINTIVTGGTMPYSYFWNDSVTTPNRLGIAAGGYSVFLSDVNGCSLSGAIVVNEPPLLWMETRLNQITCREETNGEILVNAKGGSGGYTYTWSTGENGNNIKDLDVGDYSVYLEDINGCKDTTLFTIIGNDIICIKIPNAITPNDDGINDTWIIDKLDLYPNTSIKIFNEWGKLVYTSKGGYSPWDGNYEGKPLPGATYYYIVDLNTGDPGYNGPITIIR